MEDWTGLESTAALGCVRDGQNNRSSQAAGVTAGGGDGHTDGDGDGDGSSQHSGVIAQSARRTAGLDGGAPCCDVLRCAVMC